MATATFSSLCTACPNASSIALKTEQKSCQVSSFSPNAIRRSFGLKNKQIRSCSFNTIKMSATATETPSAEKVDWKDKRAVLLKNSVKSYDANSVFKLQKEEGYVIVDVRPVDEYETLHAIDSKNAQVYRLIKNWTAWDNLRRAGFAFFGVFNGTEENPEFLKEIEACGLDKDAKIIVACSSGGTMKPSQNFPEGKQSRSLIAAFKLAQAGFKTVAHLEGGLSSWYGADLPTEGKPE